MWGRRSDGMLVAEAVRGSGKEMGPRDGTKPKAPGLNETISSRQEGKFNDFGVFGEQEEATTSEGNCRRSRRGADQFSAPFKITCGEMVSVTGG